MSRNRSVPGTKPFIYVGSAIGLARAAQQAMDEAEAPHENIHPTTSAERTDVNRKWLWIVGIGLLLGIWAIILVLYPLFTYFQYSRTGGLEPEKALSYVPPLPPEPRNESSPAEPLRTFRAREDYMLTHYFWVDRSKGIVAVPIQRAIGLLAQRGIPPIQFNAHEYYPPSAGTRRTGDISKVEPSSP